MADLETITELITKAKQLQASPEQFVTFEIFRGGERSLVTVAAGQEAAERMADFIVRARDAGQINLDPRSG